METSLEVLWSRLPLSLIISLRDLGVSSLVQLRSVWCDSDFQARLRQTKIAKEGLELLDLAAKQDEVDLFNIHRLLLIIPRQSSVYLQDLIPGQHLPCMSQQRPTPTSSLKTLHSLRSAGYDPRSFCETVVDARVQCAVAPSTAGTYNSHLLQIQSVCRFLNVVALPADLSSIRLVTAVVSHPSTLRGWLAAWRRLHAMARLPWEGDHDPILVAIQSGLRRTLAPGRPKCRCRRALLRRILLLAAAQQQWHVGAFAVLAYTFGLRAPSELVRQARGSVFDLSKPGRIFYGPITRKGKSEQQLLMRWCKCESDRVMCPHDWLAAIWREPGSQPLFTSSVQTLMRSVVRLLEQLHTPNASAFTSHCFRRGAAVDILETQGLQAMLSFGQWSSPVAAAPYASFDEQCAQALGTALIDVSDDE